MVQKLFFFFCVKGADADVGLAIEEVADANNVWHPVLENIILVGKESRQSRKVFVFLFSLSLSLSLSLYPQIVCVAHAKGPCTIKPSFKKKRKCKTLKNHENLGFFLFEERKGVFWCNDFSSQTRFCALSLFAFERERENERTKERKKEIAEKKKKKKDGRGAVFFRRPPNQERRENTNDVVSPLDETRREDEVEVVLVERERERTRAIGRVSDAEEEFVSGVRGGNDEEEEDVVSRG